MKKIIRNYSQLFAIALASGLIFSSSQAYAAEIQQETFKTKQETFKTKQETFKTKIEAIYQALLTIENAPFNQYYTIKEIPGSDGQPSKFVYEVSILEKVGSIGPKDSSEINE
ncbi:hypothetical protein [Streptococcus pyogenes]|uniref:hypothetical protein n=1 Tax=Streptococcus pyogenes TaxID=1314 RepID=UPI001C5696C6|nr:hypothetical protein [Streptococcus pyogenes]QXX48530.1 hypothetical protein G8B47_01080 [Streptococcus pyogenes]QXX60445.1 hypothetical protein G8B40_01080 [Streptococcus pyogenes]HEP1677566.1 hypothetical protein [Streptococcus pyogenes]HEP1875090.1 hypothetical protein [Streptococcus pyogenes]HEP2572052.1 hypothetical protein [Streptococcus pyogenes]